MIDRYQNISLKEYNSFGVEASAAEMLCWKDEQELRAIFRTELAGRPWYVLGGGNNILFTKDFEGVLLHSVARGIALTHDDAQRVTVRVEAGAEWDDVVAWCVERGLWGVENLSLIPGYAGAAPVQNIGAYGSEIKDVIETVEVLFADTLENRTFTREECRFGYRESIFKQELRGRAIITAVTLGLTREASPNLSYGHLEAEVTRLGGPTLENIRRAVTGIRQSKLPDPKVTGNAGSFFKNPVVAQAKIEELKAVHPDMPVYGAAPGYGKLAAGWLIDRAGWKGRSLGRAGVHADQALVLVNMGGATGAEILALAAAIRRDVEAKFGVALDMEVNVL